ncbi:TetR/AcrR family transcriptional regulator [Aquabacter sp. L1I39]|uniref:TetR/AcrR family transcriptional regulator n=1 Tax=Aquabacter sp. L1I39 TaxID=2820278 RepID=UPI001ADA89E7|nr:TetR/AcrR family transcriptional regulator [Aquabacter sp. L1I39]QTL05251.1 TetR/AcrR family transcriptional regulator [Aquabacter sp. L1I39]
MPHPEGDAGKVSRRARPAHGPEQRAARRQDILKAALEEFTRAGFGAARLEDVARAAGVAKGTLYLYFPNKQALFEGLVKENIAPVMADAAELLPHFPGTTRDLVRLLADMLVARVLQGSAAGVLRLMIAEGARFPELAAFHHREVVSQTLPLVRAVMERGLARGEITSDAAMRFPQMVFAPALTVLVWNSLFGAFDPIDAGAFVDTYLDTLLRGLGERAP